MAEVGIRYFTYDGLNRRSSLKDEVGSVWYFDYDANSNLTSQANPLAAQSTWGYDADNRKTFQQDPLSRTWYWTYDPAGNASSLKDGRAQVTYYQHDSVNLRHRVDYPDLVSHYFEFDVARQLTAMADPSGRTVESYDNFGRLTLRTNPGSQNLYYEYDAASNRTNLKDPDGKAIYYVFDSANRLEHVEAPEYSGTVAYYQYTLANERTFERKKNGVLSYYYFDNAARTSAIEHRGSGGIIEGWDYTRDELGNILLQIRRSDSMRTYWNYDQANRIALEAWRSSGGSDVYGFAYSYDAAGNRNNKQKLLSGVVNTYWNYDSADQMTIQKNNTTTTVYFTYDANGNLSVEHDVDASAGRTYYEYDPRNLLNKIDFPQAIATNYFYYNAPGERIRKDDSTGGKKYTWDALIPIVEKNLANSTTQRMMKGYTPVDGIGDYALQDVGGTVIYPHKNQVGTTMRSTDVSQVLKNTYEYDAWGQPFVASETVAQQYRFTGKELDPDFLDFNSVSRRYHFPARTYSPFGARFLQVDPLTRFLLFAILSRGKPWASKYGYASGNPVHKVDPNGRTSISFHTQDQDGEPSDPERDQPGDRRFRGAPPSYEEFRDWWERQQRNKAEGKPDAPEKRTLEDILEDLQSTEDEIYEMQKRRLKEYSEHLDEALKRQQRGQSQDELDEEWKKRTEEYDKEFERGMEKYRKQAEELDKYEQDCDRRREMI